MPDSHTLQHPEYVTGAQAATLHDVTVTTIRAWVRRGLLAPAMTVQGAHIYRLADVDKAEQQARRRDRTGRSKQRLI